MRTPVVVAAAALLLAIAEPRARAADPAAAQALFDDGTRLMSRHHFAEACEKFAESQRLDPGIGTLFHLADCDERLGRVASAWALYLQVASEAKAQGQPAREAAAHERATALEPKLPRLTIDPGPERSTPGLEIKRDGALIGQAQWDVAVPVDPGPHEIDVRARAKGLWHTTVAVAPGSPSVVTVPLLADVPAETSPAAPPSRAGVATTTAAELPTGGKRGNGQRAAGLVVGGLGLVGLGIGTYFGLVSLRDHDDAGPHCGTLGCDRTGVSLRDDARQAGTVATIALAAGGAALAVGLITFATAPRSSMQATVAISPGGVIVKGSF